MLDKYLKTKMPLQNSFSISFISENYVEKYLNYLDQNKSARLGPVGGVHQGQVQRGEKRADRGTITG